jgi:hypothetical protein
VRSRGKVQNLVDPLLECNEAAVNQFIACAGEFVRVANLEDFRQALIGIEAHTIPVGNGDEHKIEKLLEAGQSLVESLAKKPMIDPAE